MADDTRLTVSQAAAALGVSERTIRRRCTSGKLAAELVSTESGATWLIPIESLGLQPSLLPSAEPAAPAAATTPPELARLETDVQQIKAFLAGQINSREAMREDIGAALAQALSPVLMKLDELQAENSALRAELAAQRPQPGRSWWRNLIARK
jgi:predicted DNA-binding transcriptional regulator YafY